MVHSLHAGARRAAGLAVRVAERQRVVGSRPVVGQHTRVGGCGRRLETGGIGTDVVRQRVARHGGHRAGKIKRSKYEFLHIHFIENSKYVLIVHARRFWENNTL